MVNQSWNGEIASFGTGESKAGKKYGIVRIRGDFEGQKEFKTFYPAKLDKFAVGQRVHIEIWEGSKQGDIMQNIELEPSQVELAMGTAGAGCYPKSEARVEPACHDNTARRIWFGCCLNNAAALMSPRGTPSAEALAAYAQEIYSKTKDFAGVA